MRHSPAVGVVKYVANEHAIKRRRSLLLLGLPDEARKRTGEQASYRSGVCPSSTVRCLLSFAVFWGTRYM